MVINEFALPIECLLIFTLNFNFTVIWNWSHLFQWIIYELIFPATWVVIVYLFRLKMHVWIRMNRLDCFYGHKVSGICSVKCFLFSFSKRLNEYLTKVIFLYIWPSTISMTCLKMLRWCSKIDIADDKAELLCQKMHHVQFLFTGVMQCDVSCDYHHVLV